MSAWQQNSPDDRWFHVKVADLDYLALKTECAGKHPSKRGTLSVFVNVLGTEAVIKVADAKTWMPSKLTPIIKVYTPKTLPELQQLVASAEWRKLIS